MTWADPTGELRTLLGDDPLGKQIKYKRVFPQRGKGTDGSTSIFFTFEDRLVHDGNQANADPALRVWLNDVEVAASGITVLDPVRGEFSLSGVAPSGVAMKAAYFYREFIAEDLTFALRHGVIQVNGDAAHPENTPEGLQLAALSIAASLAHRRAAARWEARKSAQFLLEDAPSQEEVNQKVQFHQSQAESFMRDGLAVRLSYYDQRMDRARAPAFGLLNRQPTPWTPRR